MVTRCPGDNDDLVTSLLLCVAVLTANECRQGRRGAILVPPAKGVRQYPMAPKERPDRDRIVISSLQRMRDSVRLEDLLMTRRFKATMVVTRRAPFALPGVRVVLANDLNRLLTRITRAIPYTIDPVTISTGRVLRIYRIARMNKETKYGRD